MDRNKLSQEQSLDMAYNRRGQPGYGGLLRDRYAEWVARMGQMPPRLIPARRVVPPHTKPPDSDTLPMLAAVCETSAVFQVSP